jgi:hypothetical protein
MDFKHSKMLGDDGIRIPFNCDQGFEEYYLVYVGKTPYEHERHLDKVVCARGPLTEQEHGNCKRTPVDICWKDQANWPTPQIDAGQPQTQAPNLSLTEQIIEGSKRPKKTR